MGLKRKKYIKRVDPIYCNKLINLLINYVIKRGKRSLSYKIIYKTMEEIKKITKENPIYIFRKLMNVETNNILPVKTELIHIIPTEKCHIKGRKLALKQLFFLKKKN
uniref:Ribosomal protein S7 n=1 Tax=Sciaphila thaidanica TaxID=2161793 RepID=A0A2R4PAM5_9LILI|nr:ribosomal protein S7 [Sciaphila thaidanica]